MVSSEDLVLLAVEELGEDAYGVSVRRHLADRTGRAFSLGAIYGSLDRLVRQGVIEARLGEPTPVRGGRRKRYFRLTPRGKTWLREARRREVRLWGSAGRLRRVRAEPR